MTPVTRVRSFAAFAVFAVAARTTITPAAPASRAPADDACPWVNSTAPIAARVAQVESALTLDEKIQLVHGATGSAYVGYVPAIPRLCMPALKLQDGPGGVADGMTGVTQLPAPVAVAAKEQAATRPRRATTGSKSITRNSISSGSWGMSLSSRCL